MGSVTLTRYVVNSGLQALLVVLVVSLIVFASLHVRGDPAALMAPLDATPAEIEQIRQRLGLDRPLHVQYIEYIRKGLQGDLGMSLRFHEPVFPLVVEHLGRTVPLVLIGLLVAIVLAVPLGILAAVRRGSPIDIGVLWFALLGQAVPVFWLSIMLIQTFSVRMRWLPVAGQGTVKHFVLPVMSIAFYNLAIFLRLVRSSMLEVLREDYVRSARAKGLGEAGVVVKHAFRNAAIAVLAFLGLQLGHLISGVLVVETIFAWPGLGKLMYDAILVRDFPIVVGGSMVSAVVITGISFLLDMSFAFLDPRVRYM